MEGSRGARADRGEVSTLAIHQCPRIEGVLQAITQKVEGQHGDENQIYPDKRPKLESTRSVPGHCSAYCPNWVEGAEYPARENSAPIPAG